MAASPMRQHEDVEPEFRLVDARLHELEQKMRELTEASSKRIHDFERRLEHEWLALRQLHEDQLKDLQRRAAALSANPVDGPTSRELVGSIGEMRGGIREMLTLLGTLAAQTRRVDAEPTAREPERPAPDSSGRTLILIAALLALTVLGGYTLWRLGTDLKNTTARLASAERQVVDLRQQADQQSRAHDDAFQRVVSDAMTSAARAERMAAILASADLRDFALIGQKAAPTAAGHAIWSRARGVVLTATHVPAAPSTDVYQLWIDTTRGAVSLGFVAPDDQGRISVALDTPPALPGSVWGFLVSLEPAGGNLKPGDQIAMATPR